MPLTADPIAGSEAQTLPGLLLRRCERTPEGEVYRQYVPASAQPGLGSGRMGKSCGAARPGRGRFSYPWRRLAGAAMPSHLRSLRASGALTCSIPKPPAPTAQVARERTVAVVAALPSSGDPPAGHRARKNLRHRCLR